MNRTVNNVNSFYSLLRSCDCGTIEEGIIIEEPELVSTASIRQRDIGIVIWRRI